MKDKALSNIDAAQKLINDRTFPTESVHCSYYAVYQYMMYMLSHTDRSPMSYEEQKNHAQGKDSHLFVLQEIKQRMRGSISAQKDFYDAVADLKNARVVADYTTDSISQDDSMRYLSQARGLISKLKQYFGNI